VVLLTVTFGVKVGQATYQIGQGGEVAERSA
jgi:hypothetical protein